MNDRFLWAEFQLDAICAELSDNGIEKALEKVPEDLNATYKRILKTINKKPRAQREVARKVLIWTAYTQQPLSICDLAHAISVEGHTQSLKDLESSIPTEKNILYACASLISIDRTPPRYVRFIHFSIQEFITSYQSKYIETLSIGHEVAHREIAQMCMRFLSLFPKRRDSLGLYSLNKWPHHLLAGNLNNLQLDDQIVTLTLSFFDTRPILFTKQPRQLDTPWHTTTAYLKFSPSVLALIFNLPGIQEDRPLCEPLEGEQPKALYDYDLRCIVLADNQMAIHYATAELNSVPVAQRLYKHGYVLNYSYPDPQGKNINIHDWLKLPPLYSVQGIQMARFLLENGTSIEPQYLRRTLIDPLEYCIKRGGLSIEVLQLLLNRLGAVDQNRERLTHALQAAIWISNIEVIQLLLDKGADINIQVGQYGNALQTAVWRGNIEVIQLLLDKGANINILGGKYGNALQAATWMSNLEVIQLLLDKGADVNIKGGEYGNTLQTAVYGGNVKIIRLLLDKGADVNFQGGKCGNALQAAVCGGNVKIIQLLLDKGANINIQGGEYGNALQAAAWKGNVEVIQLLLDRGADVNIQGGQWGTELQAAVCDGNMKVIQLLLDRGADVNIQGGEYGNALQAAAWRGNVEVIQLLLDNGANVNIQGGNYGNALQTATWMSTMEVMRLLLDKGADINIQGGEYGSTLQAAVWRGDVEVIRLLLGKGANVNIQGGKYGSALQAAVWRGNVEVIQLLLDKGADINTQSGEYGNALQTAAWISNVRVVRLLLDQGANVHARGGKYGTALQAALAPCPNLKTKKLKTILSVAELLLDYGADITMCVPDSEYGSVLAAAKQIWKQDEHSLDAFTTLLASRGWKGDEAGSDEGVLKASQKLKEAAAGIGVLVHVWKLCGFAILVFLLYSFIQF